VNGSITNLDYISQIQKLAEFTDLRKAIYHVSEIERTIELIEHNVNARLALEVLLMDFPKIDIMS
jgi:hypothetical protein